jgi:hypothetical protein
MIPPPELQDQQQLSEDLGGSGVLFGKEVCEEQGACVLGSRADFASNVYGHLTVLLQPQRQPSTKQHQYDNSVNVRLPHAVGA